MATNQRIVSFGGHNINDGTNYTATFLGTLGLPEVQPYLVGRLRRWPLVSGVERPGRTLTIGIAIEGASPATLRTQLKQWLDPEDETPQRLVIEDDGGANDRYVYAICKALDAKADGAGLLWIATLVVHGDVRWRKTTADTSTWTITASGQTRVLANGGEDDTYPIFTVEPTSNLTGGYAYKQFVPVYWPASASFTKYPLDICNDGFNTQTLVSGGKMQADGDDLRVFVDGIETYRWLDGINTTTTKVFCNLNFSAKWESTIVSAMGSGDTVETIDVNTSTAGAPSTGILIIGSEAFTYTGKNDSLQRFTGVTRTAKGTAAAGHSASDAIWWCQHDIWILYGNATASAPTVDDNYKPTFELDLSTNASWVYEVFGEDDGLRTGAWVSQVIMGSPSFYGGDRATAADPWVELGLGGTTAQGRRYLYNPCGISAADFTNGEKYAVAVGWWGETYIGSSVNGSTWANEYTIAAPAVNSTWEAWSRNETLDSESKYVAVSKLAVGYAQYVEAADCTLTITTPPTVTIGGEQGNYSLDAIIENQTTGDPIRITYTMALNEEIEIDTDAKTVIDLEDGSSQFQALEVVGGARRDWLPLQPGNNTLEWTQVGTNAVTVTVDWEERHY